MHPREIEVRTEWVEYNTEHTLHVTKSYCYIVPEMHTTVNLKLLTVNNYCLQIPVNAYPILLFRI